jgi:hypothetical protein
MICQACGVEAPTKYSAYHRNIGALVMRFSNSVQGNLCKSCQHKFFWQYTLVNLTVGWWGVISFIVTPFFVLNNVYRYLTALGMDPVPIGATVPQLTDDVVQRLGPHTQALIDRLNAGEPFERIAENIGMQARVSPGQVALYVQALVAAQQSEQR